MPLDLPAISPYTLCELFTHKWSRTCALSTFKLLIILSSDIFQSSKHILGKNDNDRNKKGWWKQARNILILIEHTCFLYTHALSVFDYFLKLALRRLEVPIVKWRQPGLISFIKFCYMKQNTKTIQEVFTWRSTRFFISNTFISSNRGWNWQKIKTAKQHHEVDFLTKIFR